MPLIELYSSTVWRREEERFRELEDAIRIPNTRLNEVDVVELSGPSHFDSIPESGGCYWLWTNEPINHKLHRNRLPDRFDGGEIIYNGIAKDNVRLRLKHHLLGEPDAGWSGISIDIYPGEARSHKKKGLLMNRKGSVSRSRAIPPNQVQGIAT